MILKHEFNIDGSDNCELSLKIHHGINYWTLTTSALQLGKTLEKKNPSM